MKSFEERKAEVLLRSEKRIKRRKRIRNAVLTCVPLLICLCVLSVTAAPRLLSAKKSFPGDAIASSDGPVGAPAGENADAHNGGNHTVPPSEGSDKNGAQSPDTSSAETAIAENDVWIYFVSGGGIDKERVFLPCTAEDVFAAWKAKNGIGDEVKLVSIRIEDNATTDSSTFQGSEIITHTVGDRFILNLTVSKNIESYYAPAGRELLLDALKKTMTEYNGIRYDEYHLYFE